MSIGEDISAHLAADPGVSAINDDRVYPSYRETGDTAIVYSEISTDMPFNVSFTDDVTRSIYQLDCWARRYETARALADAVTASIHKARALNGKAIELIYIVNRIDNYDPTGDGRHRVILDVSINY